MIYDLVKKRFRIVSKAKVNLRLKVENYSVKTGFHDLSLINVGLSLFDELHVQFVRLPKSTILEKKPDEFLDSSYSKTAIFDAASVCTITVKTRAGCFFDPEHIQFIKDPNHNFIGKSYYSFVKATGFPYGINVTLKKNIPMGSGLGGGSSNVGSILQLLLSLTNKHPNFFPCGQKTAQSVLKNIAEQAGSDVPYFLQGGFAHLLGRGEKFFSLRPIGIRVPCIIVSPQFHMSTKDVYEKLRTTRTDYVYSEKDQDLIGRAFAEQTLRKNAKAEYEKEEELDVYAKILSLIENDLSHTAVMMYPELERALFAFNNKVFNQSNGTYVASLTGSGSSFFVLPTNPFSSSKLLLSSVQKILEQQHLNYHCSISRLVFK
jgi:4-diphosphocytidyl-2-C-methyl-D-erythritol kinase